MLLHANNFDTYFSKFKSDAQESGTIFLDTETTGVAWQHGDVPFAIIVSGDGRNIYYLNLNPFDSNWPRISPENLEALRAFVFNFRGRIVAHNAKFDMHMLSNIGFDWADVAVYDTMVLHRYVVNNLMKYSLDALTNAKDSAVKAWIKQNPKTAKSIGRDGKLVPCYHRVPTSIMQPYAEQDVRALAGLYSWQQTQFAKMAQEGLGQSENIDVEMAATSALWRMERRGVPVDRAYTQAALVDGRAEAMAARAKFELLAGVPFVDSGKSIEKVFDQFGVQLPRTEPTKTAPSGNPSCAGDVLEKIPPQMAAVGHPHAKKVAEIVETIFSIKENEKRCSTYYNNFLELSDSESVLHCDFRQTGADTLRMSCAAPNLQNVPKASGDGPGLAYPVRGCFVPPAGYQFCSLDFQAQEFRIAMDLAGEVELSRKVQFEGLDVHEATAAQMGVPRKQAKTINFLLLYGGGVGALAESLKTSVDEARRLKALYFARLPAIARFVQECAREAELDKFIINGYGARLWIDEGRSYIATDYKIQGTAALHTKRALVAVDAYLKGKKSYVALVIHDELLLAVHDSEHFIVPVVRELMEKSYPHLILPMGTSEEWQPCRWGEERL